MMNATKTNDALARAIAYLGADVVQLGIAETVIGGSGPGRNETRTLQPTLYAFPLIGGNAYVVTDEQDLYDAQIEADRCMDNDPVPYMQHERSMPSWWSPERRFAWQCDDCGEICETQDDLARVCTSRSVSRITASLETGEEIPA